jgi:hypothetical protein
MSHRSTHWPLKRAIHAAARQAWLDGVDMETIAHTIDCAAFFAEKMAIYGADEYPRIERPSQGPEWLDHASQLSAA